MLRRWASWVKPSAGRPSKRIPRAPDSSPGSKDRSRRNGGFPRKGPEVLLRGPAVFHHLPDRSMKRVRVTNLP